MRTIAIEEHFLARGFRVVLQSHASISPADKEKISHLNAERLLGLA